ncbi:hypothetical protein HFO93_19965 [Rhizobium leguminosarum]|uniref:hypothetical protein n=1 Tax=Rhizobium leguminosarum TaxID=384 RepID=UPI001C95171F|nr:hypothetical protein [Rhizobium leguminosarum]MBY5445716.1 hypothetical protein [Rhizobium leguminosarum]
MRSFLVLFGFLFLVTSSVASRAQSVLDLLPGYPITNIGDPIPDSTIQAWLDISTVCRNPKAGIDAFPAKVDDKPVGGVEAPERKNDPLYYCNDGDQTTYNGMLCAAGIAIGCRGVAASQDQAGRWFRSPHRLWMWTARCPELRTSDPVLFKERCANGFSPDMNLGVLLYTLHTHDILRYEKWLNWLNRNAATTVLCKVSGNETDGFSMSECTPAEWPRVCTDDLGYTKGNFAIFGKYGGNCALRPWDALDFAAVNEALGVAPPARMSNWDASSRVMLRTVKELVGSVVPTTRAIDGPPLVFQSLFDKNEDPGYPLHLDAIRVLMRMMILNPSLRMDNLPSLPSPDNAPGVLDLALSDATDPGSVNIAAKIIWRRNPSNPFFALLALGPTPEVRQRILDLCPLETDTKTGTGIDRTHWLWEKGPKEAIFDRNHSMGWDCVFVGSLYNRMRVKKDLVDELLDKFLAFADPISAALKHANEALQLAESASDLKLKALKAAQKSFDDANEFVTTGYEKARDEALKSIAAKQQDIINLNAEAHTLATKTIFDLHHKVTNIICKYDPTGVCKRALGAAENELKAAEDRLNFIQNTAIKQANDAIASFNKTIGDLDNRVQETRTQIQKGTYQLAIKEAQAEVRVAGPILDTARKGVAVAQRADNRLKSLLAVWRNDDAVEDSLAEPAEVPILPSTGPSSSAPRSSGSAANNTLGSGLGSKQHIPGKLPPKGPTKTKRVRMFTVELQDIPGSIRSYKQLADGSWTRKNSEDGKVTRWRAEERITLDGCTGQTLVMLPIGAGTRYEVFVPDKDCAAMIAKSQIEGMEWRVMGAMKNIK